MANGLDSEYSNGALQRAASDAYAAGISPHYSSFPLALGATNEYVGAGAFLVGEFRRFKDSDAYSTIVDYLKMPKQKVATLRDGLVDRLDQISNSQRIQNLRQNIFTPRQQHGILRP
ncbi:hypothetical protein HON49_03470 [archaeon]|jgi:hypothetical protein|nr:hypothetical protein [archaeon]